MMRHPVAPRFRAGTDEAVKTALSADPEGLKARIQGILDVQTRANVSVQDPLVRGFRDLFWFDFHDGDVREACLADEVHPSIGARIPAEVEGGANRVFVFDFAL
jgi:hypothetical protein